MSRNIKITPVTKAVYLGEGPHWDAEKQRLYFVDLYKSKVLSYNPASGKLHSAVIGDKPVTLIIPIAGEKDKFLISYNRDLEIITWDGESPQVSDRKHYLTLETNEGVRMNDGKTNPDGILFAGSMSIEYPDGTILPEMGNLFLVKNKTAKLLLGKVGISNGLAWNKDHTEFYYNDTLSCKTYKFKWDSKNEELCDREVLVDFKPRNIKGLPDGLAIDTEGFLWIACIKGSQIIKVDPENGAVLCDIQLPCSDVTSVAFGGPNCEDLYCTTSVHNVDNPKSPAGCILKITGHGARGYPGVPMTNL